MIFADLLFLTGFLPLFFVAYYLTPQRFKNIVALAGSLIFYAWGAPIFVFVLAASVTTDFFLSHQIEKAKATPNGSPKLWMSIFLVLNLGLLAYFKYVNFFVADLNEFLSWMGNSPVSWVNIALPFGISFFTFQKLSYGLDVYRGERPAAKRFLDYFLYVVLFPQLVMGPIVRYKEIEAQIQDRTQNETWEYRLAGLWRFIIGLSRKVLIANPIGIVVDQIFALPEAQLSTSTAWIGLFAFAFYIYFDFSGYADMAIGLGKMMGFRLPENFRSPYIARSITEFWQRWHITLGAWFRDYLYRSVRGKRNAKGQRSRTMLSLWAVFLLMALWHGASWSWILWGVYNGLFITLERKFFADQIKKWPRFPFLVYGFGITLLGMVMFKLQNLSQITHFYATLFGGGAEKQNLLVLGIRLDAKFWFLMAIAAVFSFAGAIPQVEKWQQKLLDLKLGSSQIIIATVLALGLLLLCFAELSAFGFKPFLYADF